MHVAIFTTHPLFQRHFATELELAQKHLNAGDTVTLLYCNGEMLACETNEEHSPSRCRLCITSREKGINSLKNTQNLHTQTFLHFTKGNAQELQTFGLENNFAAIFPTMDDLMALSIDNYDLGSSVLSSVICSLKDSTPDIEQHKDLLQRYFIAAFIVYRSIQNFLRQNAVHRFYIFNGRMSITRAILRACESEGVEFYTHECGNDAHTYSLFHNTMPHGIQMMTDLMIDHWNKAHLNTEREKIGATWYQNRAKGVKVNGYSFVEQQQAGLLPSNYNLQKRQIAIFNTGSFEYVTVGDDYKNHLYSSQMQGLERIIESLQPYNHEYHITIRIHPNLMGLPKEINPVLALQSDFVTVIPPESPVSTYTLLQHSEKIIVFNSTVGIEAVYFGKPSILAGKTAYQDLGGNYTPQTHDELIQLVLDTQLPPKDNSGALIYGYFLNTFGIPFEFYKAHTFFGGTFNGVLPMANRWLFRAATLYKRIMPLGVQKKLTQRFINKSYQKTTSQPS